MTNFMDQAILDLEIFFNDFAESHNINGRVLNVIVDNDRLTERTQKEFDGISIGELLYFAKASDYGDMPSIGEAQRFDRRQMYIADVKDLSGIYEIILTQNLGG